MIVNDLQNDLVPARCNALVMSGTHRARPTDRGANNSQRVEQRMLLGSSPSNWLARREHLARRTQIKHGQQFHSRHAEILQIRNLLNQPGIRAALRGIDAGIWTSSEAGDVQFVNHGAGVRPTQRLIAFPNRSGLRR
jgi:hypothetical protein